MRDLIINFAPTGMVPTKSHTPHVPISQTEIVDAVLEAHSLGASIAHLHTRNAVTGSPEMDVDALGTIITTVRKYAPNIIVCASLSGRSVSDPEIRALPLTLTGMAKPDMASLTLSSHNFVIQASVNSPATIQFLAKKMLAQGVVPELEVFDLGMINYLKYLIDKKLIIPPCYANVIFGNIAGLQATYTEFGAVENSLPRDLIWSAGGIGSSQSVATSLAIVGGFGVRVGIEDNLWMDQERTTLATNRMLIERVLKLADLLERPIMSDINARVHLGLLPGDGLYGRVTPIGEREPA